MGLDRRLLMPDLPDDRQATTALQYHVQRFRAIFDGVFESIALLKPDGNLIEVNLTAAKSLRIGAEAAIDLPFWSASCWIASAVQQQLQESIAASAQGAFISYETEVMGADNRPLPLDFSLTPIRDPHGETILILAQGRDLRTIEHFHTPIPDVGDDMGQILPVDRDLTGRKQLELINQAQTVELQQLNHALMLAQPTVRW